MPRPLRTRKQVPAAPSLAKKKSNAKPSPKVAAEDKVAKITTTKTKKVRSAATQPTPSSEAPPSSPFAVVERKTTRETTTFAVEIAETKKKKEEEGSAQAVKKARRTKASQANIKKTTRRIVQVEKSVTPEPEKAELVSTGVVPQTPPPPPPETEMISPMQSSNAENRSPQIMPSLTSSPPLMRPLAPKANAGQVEVFEFSSDAGYTPPPPTRTQRLDSTERPRLADLEPRTLEPLGKDYEEVEGYEDGERLPSPTPRRNARASNIYGEEFGGPSRAPPSAQPQGKPFFLGGDDEPFMIYSDPKSPTTPPRSLDNNDKTPRPPESTSPTPRKRRSSDAGIESDGEDTVVEVLPTRTKRQKKKPATRGGKKGKELHEVKTTDELRSMLPRRRKASKGDVFDLGSSELTDSSDMDELSRPIRGKKKAGKPSKTAVSAQAKTTKNAWSRPLGSAKKTPAKTYSRKSLGHDTDGIVVHSDDDDEAVNLPVPPPSSTAGSSIEVGDGVVDREGKKVLKKMKQKFDEVDQWGLEFDDVSVGSLEQTSDSQKR